MDRRAKVNLREEEAGGTDAGLCEGAGHIRQQVRGEDTGLDPAVSCAELNMLLRTAGLIILWK